MSAHHSRETPLELLKRRYAAGELTTQEYEERKAVLEWYASSAKPDAGSR